VDQEFRNSLAGLFQLRVSDEFVVTCLLELIKGLVEIRGSTLGDIFTVGEAGAGCW
jgi:hypothetical protein